MASKAARRPKAWFIAIAWTLGLSSGAGLVLFPHAAHWFTTRVQAGDVVEHAHVLAAMSGTEVAELVDAAHAYNARLAEGLAGRTSYHHPEYLGLLNPGGRPVMSTVTVPSLSLTVPVYHGTSDEVLYRGAGHHYGSSLPVGGPDTHTVITAHSGLMRARLFTDLERLGVGDVFFFTTAGTQLWYEVDQIVIVLPGDYQEYLGIEPGQDLATLFTCTPTGVNSHRLVVRGHRIPPPEVGDVRHSEMMLEAGFPWWAAILGGTLLATSVSGKFLFLPKRAPAAGTPGPAGMPGLPATIGEQAGSELGEAPAPPPGPSARRRSGHLPRHSR
ncbi:MAG: class C sortase [Promicromonosporaceae bacterium]|nr:class C sortase [Promicromonosporaceae bacterium]